MYKAALPISLISFNRPHYFEHTVRSLENQTDLDKTHFHLFQDGRVNKFTHNEQTSLVPWMKQINLFRDAKLPNKREVINKHNIGNGLQQYNILECMSDNYEYFLMVEDDVILSKHYLKLIRIMIDQYMSKNDVFSVSLSFRRTCKKSEIDQNLDNVVYDNQHWWAECISAKKYKQARKYFKRYIKHIEDCEYSRRPHGRIRGFFRSEGLDIPQTSQDAGKDYMLYKAGMRRITSVVNRGYYIGEKGLHFRAETYNQYGFADMKPFEFESDANIKSFDLVE